MLKVPPGFLEGATFLFIKHLKKMRHQNLLALIITESLEVMKRYT